MALSSRPPVETIPVMASVRARSPERTVSVSPTRRLLRWASPAPIRVSSAPSENHRPSTCHQGSVEETPVTNLLPSGTLTVWLYHVPINVTRTVSRAFSRELAPGACFPDADTVAISTGTSRNGANHTTLLRQKIVFSLPRSPSGKYRSEE